MKSATRGQFVVIEGIDGAGKGNAINALKGFCENNQLAAVFTREPGGTPLAESIRKLLTQRIDEPFPAEAELLLMFAARSAHVSNLVKPSLVSGKHVICDRFTDSSYAYQGAGRGMDPIQIDSLTKIVNPEVTPDITFVLDLPIETAQQRSQERGNPDRFDDESNAFMRRVRDCYLERAALQPDRYIVIDASQSPEQVRAAVANHFSKFLETL